ncbi:MAG: hypothetical protein ACHQVS_01425 [Candidatus Babeliales bacterium]
MDGLRYYVGSLLLIAFAINGAEKEKTSLSPKLKINAALPAGKLYISSRVFYIPLSGDTITIAAIKELFKQEIEELAHKEIGNCSCGGPCDDARAARLLMPDKDKPLQIVYWGKLVEDKATLSELDSFKLEHSVLHAMFSKKTKTETDEKKA